MRTIGFSTGALAYSDFRLGLSMLLDLGIKAIELSSLRMPEWPLMLQALDSLDLSSFEYISVHLPSKMDKSEEYKVIQSLDNWNSQYGWPLVLHPDAITDWNAWKSLGSIVCVENMDIRKPIGRTEADLEAIFAKLPEARLCFDIGHAWQVDPTMGEAYWILKSFKERLVQVHVSEVNSQSKHDSLSYATMESFREVAHMIPSHVPLILESPVSKDQIRVEIEHARSALTIPTGKPQLVA